MWTTQTLRCLPRGHQCPALQCILSGTVEKQGGRSMTARSVQIWWESTLYGGWRIVARRVIAWTLYVLLLCVALAVQTVLAIEAKNERDDNLRGDDPPTMGGAPVRCVHDACCPGGACWHAVCAHAWRGCCGTS